MSIIHATYQDGFIETEILIPCPNGASLRGRYEHLPEKIEFTEKPAYRLSLRLIQYRS